MDTPRLTVRRGISERVARIAVERAERPIISRGQAASRPPA